MQVNSPTPLPKPLFTEGEIVYNQHATPRMDSKGKACTRCVVLADSSASRTKEIFPQYAIECEDKKEPINKRNWVPYPCGDKTVYLSVDGLYKRLGVPKEIVRTAAIVGADDVKRVIDHYKNDIRSGMISTREALNKFNEEATKETYDALYTQARNAIDPEIHHHIDYFLKRFEDADFKDPAVQKAVQQAIAELEKTAWF